MKTTILAAILSAAAFGATAQAADLSAKAEIHFAFDSAALPLDLATEVTSVVAYASAHPNARVVLDAHCDPSGTSAYNVRLAIRRAEAVRTALTRAGIDNAQIVLAIYGKNGAHRASYADDRRVGIHLTNDAVATVIDETLAGHGTAVRWERPMTEAQIEAPTGDAVAGR